MSAECKKLRGPNDTGPDCGCRGDACALGRDAATLHERLHDEYESLGMLSYHGGLTPDLWWADLTKADIEEIRELLRDAGAAVRALELVAESKGENLLVDGVIYGPSMYAAHALEKR